MASTISEIINLEKENELKITLNKPNEKITLQLTEGSAEIFGSQLFIGNCYEFSYFSSFTIYTFDGCTLKLRKEASKSCIHKVSSSKEIPKMIDLHYYLEEMRRDAEVNYTKGPITLIVGPTDSGKSTLCRLLLNYAVKQGRTPVFIDLDVGQGSLSPTGTFGVLTVEEPSDIYGRFNEQVISIYYFGYKSPGINMKLYTLLLEKLGQSLKNRFNQEHLTRTSGAIINTCGWIDRGGYQLITDAVTFFHVDTIFVLSERSLYNKLKRDICNEAKVIYVSKRKGTVERDKHKIKK